MHAGGDSGFAVVAEYSTDALLQAVGRLSDAGSFAQGLRVLISNYGLLSEDDAMVFSWCDREKGVAGEVFASAYAGKLFPSGLSRPLENTSVGYFLKHGAAELHAVEIDKLSNEVNTDFDRYHQALVRSVVGVPVIWRLQVIGVVQMLRLRPADSRHLPFVEQLAGLLAPHLALARSSVVVDSIRNQYADLTDLAGLAASGADIQDVFGGIGNYLRKHVGFDAMTIRIREGTTGQSKPEYQQGVIDFSLLEKSGEANEGIAPHLMAMAVGRTAAFSIGTGVSDDRMIRDHSVSQFLEHVPSILVAPLWHRRNFIGTIECYSLNEGAYRSDDVDKINQLAGLALHGIVQSRLTVEMNQQIKLRESLAELTRISVIATDPGAVLSSICTELAKILSFNHVTFYLPNPLVATKDGLHTAFRGFTYSAIPYSKIETLSIDEIESVTGSLAFEDEPLFTMAEKLSGLKESEGSYIALSSQSQPTENDRILFREAARHIAPAVNHMMLNIRNGQLVEERRRTLQAETDVQHFQEVDKMKKEIMSTVTHELRTPLTSITAFVDILSRNHPENLTKGQLDNLEVIRRSSLAVSNIVSDLDELVSLEPSNLDLLYEETDLTEVIKNLDNDIRPLLRPTGHKLRLTMTRRSVPAVVDRIRLAQVLSNLVNNAAKYSHRESIIRLLLRVSGGNAHFFVKDQGEGIPPDEPKDLFQLFTRAGSQRSGTVDGSGIGLYVCEKIVRAHGGRINLHSELGNGTTVHFWIPLTNASRIEGIGS